MQWVSASLSFPHRRAVIEIPDVFGFAESIRVACGAPVDLAAVESLLRMLITEDLPELKGCTIHYLGYEPLSRKWQVGISHSSLAPVADGSCSPRIIVPKETGHPAGQGDPDSVAAGDEP